MKNNAGATGLNERAIHASFFIGETEYSLSVTYVQEVVKSPAAFTPLPLAPSHLKGLFNLRGLIVPVVDLRALLDQPVGESREEMIAVVQLYGQSLGILFDRTGEIFTGRAEERGDFTAGLGDDLVTGVFRREGGSRVVQMLNIQRVFKLSALPVDALPGELRGRSRAPQNRGPRRQCISFVVGSAKCALSIDGIQEILKIPRLAASPLAVGACIGMIDLRGRTLAVLDFAALLSYREPDRSAGATEGARRIVVMRADGGWFGLLVDSVADIITYFGDELVDVSVQTDPRANLFAGCIVREGSDNVLLLNHASVMDDAEIQNVVRGHGSVYRNGQGTGSDVAAKTGPRRTYVIFKIERTYAVDIGDVREVIDYPQDLLRPPGMPAQFEGVLDLRGQLVTLVDARAMYAEEPAADPRAGKVLIFNRAGLHFGLIVDAVDSILSFNESAGLRLPEGLYRSERPGLSEDILEGIEVAGDDGRRRSFLILSADAITSRVGRALTAA